MRKGKIFLFFAVFAFFLTAYGKKPASYDRSAPLRTNPGFFFPMEDDTKTITVRCERNAEDRFEGTADLIIRRLPDTKLHNYYEIILSDLKGKCSGYDDCSDSDCEFSKNFPVAYFYADREAIYMMDHADSYLNIFKETDTFPPAQNYIDSLHRNMDENGQHEGYFVYRLVCSETGFCDTFEMMQDDPERAETPSDGKIWDNRYHNYIEADRGERRYYLFPDECSGTEEFMYITWKENQGIVSYSSWSGAQKDYISIEAADTANETANEGKVLPGK